MILVCANSRLDTSTSVAQAPTTTTASIVATTTQANGWRLALAGGIAGAISNSLLHPLDTIKTVRQYDPKSFKGVITTGRNIINQRGIGALYSGLLPALLGSAISSALYFGAYEFSKRRLTKHIAAPRQLLHGVSAVCGNVASSVLFVPKEVVKSRMQAGVEQAKFINAFRGTIHNHGIFGLYRGYKATLLRNIPSTVLRFVLFEEFRRVVQGDARNPRNLAQFLLAGALAGGIASGITTPLDVVKTRLSTGVLSTGTNVLPALKHIAVSQGVRGLYVGVRPRVLWSALGTGVGFGSYELCKALLRADVHSNQTQSKQHQIVVN